MQHGTCLFCAIAKGEFPSHPVFGNERLYAFLDIHPIRAGHLQIVPRQHFDYFDDLPPELATEILHLGQRLARVMKQIYGVGRVGFLFTGGDVAHAHAHVVPLHAGNDITSQRYIVEQDITYQNPPRQSDGELAETAARLSDQLNALD